MDSHVVLPLQSPPQSQQGLTQSPPLVARFVQQEELANAKTRIGAPIVPELGVTLVATLKK